MITRSAISGLSDDGVMLFQTCLTDYFLFLLERRYFESQWGSNNIEHTFIYLFIYLFSNFMSNNDNQKLFIIDRKSGSYCSLFATKLISTQK